MLACWDLPPVIHIDVNVIQSDAIRRKNIRRLRRSTWVHLPAMPSAGCIREQIVSCAALPASHRIRLTAQKRPNRVHELASGPGGSLLVKTLSVNFAYPERPVIANFWHEPLQLSYRHNE